MTVYFAQVAGNGPIKIGFTRKCLEMKLRRLRWACPYPLVILATMDGTAPEEKRLHARFGAHRIHGEWFHPSPVLLAFIAQIPHDGECPVTLPKWRGVLVLPSTPSDLSKARTA